MTEALLKAADYISPMTLSFPSTRCVSFSEQPRKNLKPREDFYRIRRQSADAIMYGGMENYMHMRDEFDEGYGYEIEERSHEAFGLEPQSIEVVSDLEATFVVKERGMVRWAALGWF